MTFSLQSLTVPDFGLPLALPAIPPETYRRRSEQAYRRAACDWLLVYADREHFANMMFLCGFEPRFEEALLLLGPRGRRILLVGFECVGYAASAGLPDLEIVLWASFSLMGLNRPGPAGLHGLLQQAGLRAGQDFGIVGWKYFEPEEWPFAEPTFFVPASVVDCVRLVARPAGHLFDATPVMMHPATGLRSAVDADQIAIAEWGASRASAAVWRVVGGVGEGDSELMAAARMGYAGEPMNAHVMVSSGNASDPVSGLRSPGARRMRRGDGAVCAISYWGGLSARAGLVDTGNDDFLRLACVYMEAIAAWYATADIGTAGGDLFDAVTATLARGKLKSALNPGHISGHDEWMHTPVRSGSLETMASGCLLQVDISPTPLPPGTAMACIDSVVLADQALRDELRRLHPEVLARMSARRQFMRNAVGVDLGESILPLSSAPFCYAPFWLRPNMLLVRD